MGLINICVSQLQGAWPADWSAAAKAEANLREFKARMREAATLKPHLIVAGETVNHCGMAASECEPSESVLEGPFYQIASAVAAQHQCYICYGIAAQYDGAYRNAAVLLAAAGQLVGTYAKVHLTSNEKASGLVAGDEFPVFATDLGPIGILICHDMSFPESARSLMLGGARLLLWPTLWRGWGEQLSYAVIASRCIDNACCLVLASVGQDPQDPVWDAAAGIKGRSAIFNAEGQIVAQKADRCPGVVCGQVDPMLDRVAPDFTRGPDDRFRECVLRERRPECYQRLISPAAGIPPV